MESNIIILNSCQEFTKQCLNTGSAFTFSLTIWNGISYKFSNPHPKQDQDCRNANWTNAISTQRKKTPSQHRRDRRRWEDHQQQKSSSTPASGHLSQEAGHQPSVSGFQSPVAGFQPPVAGIQPPATGHPQDPVDLSMKSTTPVIEEPLPKPENSDAMDTLEEEVEDPVMDETRITSEAIDGASNSLMSLNNETLRKNDVPPLISPINSPVKALEEIRLLFCASDEAEARSLSNRKFPHSKYIGPHPKNHHHHLFSFQPTSADLQFLKMNLNYLSMKFNLITFRIISENKNYHAEQKHHCQECQTRHHKK